MGTSAETEGRRAILVIDDDSRNRTLVRGRLSSSYDVLEAENGAIGLELLGRSTVDLILLDVMMPGLNGFDVCRAIKSVPREGFLPVVLFTALDSQDERNQGLAAGADDFLTKPVDSRELALRVGALVRLREQDERIRAHVSKLRDQEALIRRQLDELQHLQALKDDLVSLLVHDLRNPLSGVIGYLELLQFQLSAGSDPATRQHAERAIEASKQLKDLVDEVLEVQRIEDGALPLVRAPVRLVELAHDASRLVAGAALPRGVVVEVVERDESPVVSVDRGLLLRALENLLANAIRFSPARERVSVTIGANGERTYIEVADRGPGISETMRGRIFEKFGSLDAKKSGDRRRGFGLGLHLVKLVAGAHGGDVFVRGREGGGSIFGVSLPLPPDARSAPAS